MAARYQVTCIIPDGNDRDRRIDSIGGTAGGQGWRLKLDDAIAGIKAGSWEFFVMVYGVETKVIVARRNGREYLKTVADGEEPNNLLNLPPCR